MTIQFNLLPDIKIQYLKAKRQKHLVVLASVSAIIIALTVFVLLIVTVFLLQKKNISDLNKDIKATSDQLQSVPDLNKILTVQTQLNSLTSLHDQKVVASRLNNYISQITPATVALTKFTVDFQANTMTIAGITSDFTAVNTYTDTLKTTKYALTSGSSAQKAAFSNVVLTSFTRDTTSARFEIGLSFDPTIFQSSATGVQLVVPQTVARPTSLFEKEGQ